MGRTYRASASVPDAAELLTLPDLAAVLRIGFRTAIRRREAGLLPEPIRMGSQRMIRWRRGEIMDWLAAGCPDGKTWEAMKARRGKEKPRGRRAEPTAV
jgi:predicted DNA-binding transcriptional regulator AlpA